MVRVFSSISRVAVEQRKALLQSRGVACEVKNEYQVAMGHVPADCWPELWVVDDSRLDEARQLLADFSDPEEVQGSSWLCQGCGEQIEAQFGECWHCGATRPSTDI